MDPRFPLCRAQWVSRRAIGSHADREEAPGDELSIGEGPHGDEWFQANKVVTVAGPDFGVVCSGSRCEEEVGDASPWLSTDLDERSREMSILACYRVADRQRVEGLFGHTEPAQSLRAKLGCACDEHTEMEFSQ